MRARDLILRIETAVRSRLQMPNPWVEHELVGKSLTVRAGTFPAEADYDDAWLLECARHASVVFDVGANVGQSAMLMMRSPTVKRVILVDANWAALSVAADNLIRNQLSSSSVFVCAFMGDKSDQLIDFWTVGTGAAGSMYEGHAETAAKARSVSKVPTITLDQISEMYGLVPDLVKIDVEGAEANVLMGSSACAAKRQSRFFVEMHSPPELPMKQNAAMVLDWARANRYSVWYLSEGIRIDTPDPIAHRGRCHLLLQPEPWPYPEWLVGLKQSSPLPSS